MMVELGKEAKVETADDYTKRVNVFRIRPTSEGDILFQCEKESEVELWVSAISKAICK